MGLTPPEARTCEAVEAMLFSGDILQRPVARAAFRIYVDHWDKVLRSAKDREVKLALIKADRLCKEALPKFNWGASALDANAIEILNETPALIADALASLNQEEPK